MNNPFVFAACLCLHLFTPPLHSLSFQSCAFRDTMFATTARCSSTLTLSQDVWAFKAPLPKVDAKFLMGKPGCDNRIAYEFRRAGLRVNNPAYSIMAAHLHMSQKRNYTHGKDTVPGPYALVVPVVAL